MLKKLLLYLLFLSPFLCFSQAQYVLERELEVAADFFTADNLGNLYLVRGDEISKLAPDGKTLGKYSNKNLGLIGHLDTSNPMKILVFYRDQAVIVFLDNFLAEQSRAISLLAHGWEQATLACSSVNNGMWLYNQTGFELIRVSSTLELTERTGSIVQLVRHGIEPNGLIERNNRVYLNDPASGIMVFDILGSYYKTIPLTGIVDFQAEGDRIYFFTGTELYEYNTKTLEKRQITLNLSLQGAQVRVEKNRIFVLSGPQLGIYSALE